jgi:FADH2 O2-dependent halogenase
MSSTHDLPDYDVGIIGGGPAGASMAAYLAQAGVKVAVFERALFPREHVGESLVPSSTRVFKELGFLETMDREGFPRKYGAVWTTGTSKHYGVHDWEDLEADCRAAIRFEERAQPGVDKNYTYHVDRGKFDLLLLQHAQRLGASVFEGLQVTGVDLQTTTYPELHYAMGRRQASTTVRIVVDASGRHTLLGNQYRLKVNDPVFQQYAVHTWFEGLDRGAVADRELADYIFVHFLPIQNSWVWQIPITASITSIGVVTQKRHVAASKAGREAMFWDMLRTRPALAGQLEQARRIKPFKDEGDYSYAIKQIVGDRFVLIGDAARFVDPIFSTGVSIALNGARLAHRDVLKALETGDCSRAAFESYETTIRRGTQNWYDFISVYYRLNILFTHFINNPEHRLDVLKLLQGDVYDEAQPPVLQAMRRAVLAIEQDSSHPWHRLLNDLTAKAFQPLF